jgi:hypothetical protein
VLQEVGVQQRQDTLGVPADVGLQQGELPLDHLLQIGLCRTPGGGHQLAMSTKRL